ISIAPGQSASAFACEPCRRPLPHWKPRLLYSIAPMGTTSVPIDSGGIHSYVVVGTHNVPTDTTGAYMRKEAPITISVPEAGKRYFGWCRNAAYAAAARGDIPVIKIGRLLRVPVRALELMLDRASEPAA